MLSNDTIIMKPPYTITPRILELVALISEKLGEVRSAYLHRPPTELRRRNRIHTIQSSLEIEGNTLTVEQITALLENKRIAGPAKDILEVKNAIQTYDRIDTFKPYNLESLCQAHKLLMTGLVDRAGQFRSTSVGIVKGRVVTHIAPPSELVKPQLKELMQYLRTNKDLLLIKSCVFHYEFEFIHPFTDGNGRMGRLWQTVLLRQYNPVFEFLPMETLIKERQREYYDVLGQADNSGDSTPFVEFMLAVINDSLEKLLRSQNFALKPQNRIGLYREIAGIREFTRADYLRHFKDISTATASRDLAQGAKDGTLEKTNTGRLTRYRFRQ